MDWHLSYSLPQHRDIAVPPGSHPFSGLKTVGAHFVAKNTRGLTFYVGRA